MPKPIEEIQSLLQETLTEMKAMKMELNHIKEYMRKEEVRKTIADDIDKSYEKVPHRAKSWW